MAGDYEHITIDRIDQVGRLVLDRSERNNAMDLQMARELHYAALEVANDEDIRCICYTASGSAFNSGADLSTLAGDETDGPLLRKISNHAHGALTALLRAPKPVVVGINGVVAGGGLGHALCGDIVLMADSARFEFAFHRIGLSPDGGGLYFLPRLVGLRKAQEIAFRDAPVTADRAADIGLVTEVIPDGELDTRLAEEATDLANGPTKAYANTRHLLRTSLVTPLNEMLAREIDNLAELASTEDYSRGIEGFTSNEQPRFVGE